MGPYTYGNDIKTFWIDTARNTSDDGIILAGHEVSGNKDWLLKVGNDQKEEWRQDWSQYGSSKIYSVQQTLDGGYILAGGNSNIWLYKTDGMEIMNGT